MAPKFERREDEGQYFRRGSTIFVVWTTYCLGLRVDVRLLIYRLVIRHIVAYAFLVRSDISSHQMERLWLWERKIVSSCLGLRHFRVENGFYRAHSYMSIYDRMQIDRTKNGVAFLDRCQLIDNSGPALNSEAFVSSRAFQGERAWPASWEWQPSILSEDWCTISRGSLKLG